MPRSWKHAPLTVRPQSDQTMPWLLCLLAFSMTTLVVYDWGYQTRTAPTPKPTYTATAYVVERPHKAATVGRATATPQAGRSVAKPQGGMGELRVPIAYTGENLRRAEDVANALAERYVEDRHEEWRRRTQGPCLMAREAVETARGELAEDEARLEAFRRHLAEAAAKPQAVRQQQDRPSPPRTDNPQWVDLSRQLGELQRRHENLLADRTPLHPAVQEVAARIEDLKQQMAAIPQQIPGKLPSPSGRGAEEKLPSLAGRGVGGEGDSISKQDQDRLSELIAAVETARQACQQAEAAEKRALDEQKAGPRYAVVYAQAVENVPMPAHSWPRLVWTAILAGVLMALGVGSVSTGASIEPPAANATQVQSDAGAPVIGTIPANDPIPDPATLSRRESRVRRALLAAGLFLMAASPAAALWGIMGI